jgi:hypothetical protein
MRVYNVFDKFPKYHMKMLLGALMKLWGTVIR